MEWQHRIQATATSHCVFRSFQTVKCSQKNEKKNRKNVKEKRSLMAALSMLLKDDGFVGVLSEEVGMRLNGSNQPLKLGLIRAS